MRPISKNLGRILFTHKVQCFKNHISKIFIYLPILNYNYSHTHQIKKR